jgi:hypothetical protein
VAPGKAEFPFLFGNPKHSKTAVTELALNRGERYWESLGAIRNASWVISDSSSLEEGRLELASQMTKQAWKAEIESKKRLH